MKKLFEKVIFVIIIGCSFIFFPVNCTPQEAKTIEDLLVKVGEDTCSELVKEDAGVSEWVVLACTVGTKIVKVLLPREHWLMLKGKPPKCDAGLRPLPVQPGK